MKNTVNSITERVSRKMGIPESSARPLVRAVFDDMAATLGAGVPCEIRGFGAFHIPTRKARVGRNPRNLAAGEVVIPAHKDVKFVSGKKIRAALATK